MMERSYCAATEREMEALGESVGKGLSSGGFVALCGDLGAGKTVFARGVGKALGLKSLSSPTFTIVQEYETDPRLFHFDAYRLSGEEELYAMGYEDYLREKALILMEWANLVTEALPKERLDVFITGSGLEQRQVRFIARGGSYEALLESL